jgi:hypothetical protein
MTGPDETESPSARRRRRRRATASQGTPAPREPGPEPAANTPPPEAPVAKRPAKRSHAQRDAAEHGLRDLVGAGKSQVGVGGALRARDLNRPTEEELADAEQNLVIVRRHWQPPAESTRR